MSHRYHTMEVVSAKRVGNNVLGGAAGGTGAAEHLVQSMKRDYRTARRRCSFLNASLPPSLPPSLPIVLPFRSDRTMIGPDWLSPVWRGAPKHVRADRTARDG